MIFTVFAAAVIGGVSLDGGKGTLFGALAACIVLGLIQNILTLGRRARRSGSRPSTALIILSRWSSPG